MWFVRDAGFAVTLMGLVCMLGCVVGCSYNMFAWLGGSLLGLFLQLLLMAAASISMAAHWFTMTTNPGVIPKGIHISPVVATVDDESGYIDGHSRTSDDFIYCEWCDAHHPKRAEHCHSCNGCVVLMDHHCPWVNNCIGAGNGKNFILMLGYIPIMCLYMVLLTVAQSWMCTVNDPSATCGFRTGMSPGRAGIWVFAISCLFMLLCAMMLGMELYSISEDMTYGEIASQLVHLQDTREHASKLQQRLGILFGSDHAEWHWLVPGRDVHQRRREAEMDVILGYHED
ncbi:Aste57867_16832 [Aphanomyces stellatus]|uniref:Palmitoyltransferase n=1 Tax=Aphanomyces stellatus TaxID=120398 RepID=A0A485L7X1_9STRA|nr:hypothetical protein As57867_016774 [Aphanomyces stellatus]VFT93596.1 Aste57867_16832 [Aphanomyces stellatus]